MKDLPFMPGFIHLLPGLFSQEFVSWIGFVGGFCLENVDFSPQHHLDHLFFLHDELVFRRSLVTTLHVQFGSFSKPRWLPPFYLFFCRFFSLLGTNICPLQKQNWRWFFLFPKVGYVSSLEDSQADVLRQGGFFFAETSSPAAPHEVSQSLAQKSKCNVTGMCLFLVSEGLGVLFAWFWYVLENGSIHFANFRV